MIKTFILAAIMFHLFSPVTLTGNITSYNNYQDELKDTFISRQLNPYLSKAVEEYYGYSKPFMNTRILKVESLGSFIYFTIRLETFTGPHNPPYGVDTVIIAQEWNNIYVEDFEHDGVPPWRKYCNNQYHISLKYPVG